MRPFAIILILIAFSSCKKHEGCTKFGSENFDPDAVINDGSCIHIRDKFLGSFNVYSNCSDNYELLITETIDDYVVAISNLADSLPTIEADVYGNNITIEPQTLFPAVNIEGAGVFTTDSTIEMSYRISDSRTGSSIITDCFEQCYPIQ